MKCISQIFSSVHSLDILLFFSYYLEKHVISTMLIIKTAQELVSHHRDNEFEKRGRCDGPQLSIQNLRVQVRRVESTCSPSADSEV